MGWNISIKKIDGETKYKFWSSVSDGYITDEWMNKDEVLHFLFWHRFSGFVREFVKDSMTFPNGWTKKNNTFINIEGAEEKFYELTIKSLKESDDDKLIYKKFLEELNRLDIKIKVKDGEYNI